MSNQPARPEPVKQQSTFARRFRLSTLAIVVGAATALPLGFVTSSAHAAGLAEEDVPATSIVPENGSSPMPTPAAPRKTTTPSKPKTTVRRASSSASSARQPEIEPAQERLKLLKDGWVTATPSKNGKHVEHVVQDKFVNVTGSTRDYLQVKLKDGQIGYLDPSAVSLIKPTDKVFLLTHDASVLERPNKWARKLAEVHQGHNVHVIGFALNYMMIRMKSGLTGFIPQSALE
ncbi:MAG: hypothetical protein JWM69_1048 [Candidatus Binatus sp.]|nr:hypothetical protein [Candidatus Binatus sp.]